jgi:hypothetical protein
VIRAKYRTSDTGIGAGPGGGRGGDWLQYGNLAHTRASWEDLG